MSNSGRIRSISDAKREVTRLKQDLDDTYVRYLVALTSMPIDFQGDAHKYICIRLSGYVEQLFHMSITGYLKSNHDQSAANFALSHFKHAPNMKAGNLEQLVGRFKNGWQTSLDILLIAHNNKDNLNNLLDIRNKTAHGEAYAGSAPQVNTYKTLVDDLHNWVIANIL
jgi:hypothetical protein